MNRRVSVLCAMGIGLVLSGSSAACKGGDTTPLDRAELRLVRSPNGRIAIELLDGPENIRAVQAELVVDGSATFQLEDAEAPRGLPLDSVRMEMRGANRAILFAGDKRGVALPKSGAVATFAARANDGNSSAGSQLRIASAVVSTSDGTEVDVLIGAAIAVR